MEKNNILSFNILKKMKFNKNIAIILAILGIALIFFSDFLPGKTVKPKSDTAAVAGTADEFIAETEARIKKMAEGIAGAGSCEVMITIEGTGETIYATEGKTNKNAVDDKTGENAKQQAQEGSEKKISIISSGGEQKPIIIKELNPKIRGIAVICDGGDSPAVKSRITEMLTALLDVQSNKISVIKKS